MGIKVVDTASKTDCGNYVLSVLGLPGIPKLVDLLRELPHTDGLHDNVVVIYWEKKVPRHYGIAKKGKVRSKWGHGPVFQHDVEQVPLEYGTKVTFHDVTDEFRYRCEQILRGG